MLTLADRCFWHNVSKRDDGPSNAWRNDTPIMEWLAAAVESDDPGSGRVVRCPAARELADQCPVLRD